MTDYRLLTLSTLTPLEPAGPLPAWLVAANPSEDQIADLGWSGRTGQGYFRIAIADDPLFDPDTHRLSDPVEGKPDPKTKTIPAVREVVALTADEIAARGATLAASIDAERDRRISGGFAFQSARYQSRPDDYTNLGGASTAALTAIIQGSPAGNLRWADPDKDFAWIREDNGETPMDAQTMIALGLAALTHRSDLIFAARGLKNRAAGGETIPDVTADALWPA